MVDHHAQELLALVMRPIAHELILALGDAEVDVTSLSKTVELDCATVSRYLSQLRGKQVVTYRRNDRRHLYRLSALVRLRLTESSEHIEIATMSGDRMTFTFTKCSPASCRA